MRRNKKLIIISAIAICIIAGIIIYLIVDSRKYIGEKINYTGDAVTQIYETYNYSGSSGSFDKYLVEDIEDYDYKALIAEYVKYEDADEKVVSTYKSSDSINTIPVFGNMYECTSLVVYMFYKGESVTDTSVMQIVKENNGAKLVKWYNNLDENGKVIADEESLLAGLKNAVKPDSKFVVMGIKADGSVVGKNKSENDIKEMSYSGINSRYVGPFSTIEEMREGYKTYYSYKKELYSKLPKYPWTSKELFSVYPYGQYGTNDVYDVQLKIPLLNKDLEEGVYQTFIFLNKSNIVAEVVVSENDLKLYEYKGNQTLSNLPARYKKYSKNKYIDEILYSKVVLASWESNPGFLVKGVIFHDKQYFPYGEYNGEMWVYYYKSDTFERYAEFKEK